MKKILVTGSQGQLGQALQSVADAYSTLSLHFYPKQELDITNKKSIEKILTSQKWDCVINCAAYTNVDQAEVNPESALLINAQAVGYIAASCSQNDIYLIHISTDYVFDGKKGSPYTPNDHPNPINQYGKSKWEGEKLIQAEGGNFSIIRTSWLYSEFGDNFYTKILQKAQAGQPLFVTDQQTGNPTHAKNLANHLLSGIKNDCILKGISHFSDGESMTWLDLAHLIFLNKNICPKIYPKPQTQSNVKRPKKSII